MTSCDVAYRCLRFDDAKVQQVCARGNDTADHAQKCGDFEIWRDDPKKSLNDKEKETN